MGLFDSLGNMLGLSGNDPSKGAFDPNDPRFKLANGQQLQDQAQAGIQKFSQPAAPVFNPTQSDQSRMQLQDALGLLRQQATGAAPSVAQNQLYQSTDRGIGQLAAAMSMNRGANPGTTMRTLAGMGGDMLQGANANAATLRAGEMANGQNALVNAMSTLRGQDINQASNAGQLQIAGQGQNNDMLKFYTGLSKGVSEDDLDSALKLAGYNTTYAQAQNKTGSGLVSSLTNALSGALGGPALMPVSKGG